MSCLGSFGILKPAAPARRDSVMELEDWSLATLSVNCDANVDVARSKGENRFVKAVLAWMLGSSSRAASGAQIAVISRSRPIRR